MEILSCKTPCGPPMKRALLSLILVSYDAFSPVREHQIISISRWGTKPCAKGRQAILLLLLYDVPRIFSVGTVAENQKGAEVKPSSACSSLFVLVAETKDKPVVPGAW